jgi:SAM-dependent methyltransferase
MIPLPLRRGLAALVGRQRWIPGRYWWAMELLRDYAERDPNGFHRFLWSHHLAYAESYEVDRRFGPENLHPSRRLLFDDLTRFLRARGVDPATGVRSVFEVGCSLGYLLRHLETEVFPGAERLEGNDIDRYAVAEGNRYLERLRSRVRLTATDMSDLDGLLNGRSYDVVLCAGVLMYLREQDAVSVVRSVLHHTAGTAVFAGLAHPERDNAERGASVVRGRDDTFIHNIDRMVTEAGGTVVFRRWEGARQVDGNTIYFVFAVPGPA